MVHKKAWEQDKGNIRQKYNAELHRVEMECMMRQRHGRMEAMEMFLTHSQ